MSTLEVGLISGIAVGSVYALIAIAYNLVLASCGVFNLAQSAVFSATTVVYYLILNAGYPIPLALFAILVVGMAMGYLTEVIAVRRFLGKGTLFGGVVGLTEETLVSTLGLGLAGTAAIALLFGDNTVLVRSYVPVTPVRAGGILLQPIYLVMVGSLLLIGIGLEVFLQRTQYGLVTRTLIDDNDGASLMGINTGRVITGAFVAAGAMSALAAFLIVPITGASAHVGHSLTLFGFASLAVGGFGSFRGAIVGGIIVGIASQMAQVFLQPHWAQPAVFLLLLLVLAVRPAGVFGREGMFGARVAREV